MKKFMKKIIASAFVALFVLQTIVISQTHADFPSTEKGILYCKITSSATSSLYGLKASRNNISPDNKPFLDIVDYKMGVDWLELTYDISNYAYSPYLTAGLQTWRFKIFANYGGSTYIKNIILHDGVNVIKTYNVNQTISTSSAKEYIFDTNIPEYDLNFDGVVDSKDADLALKFALYLAVPTKLQIVFGDKNGNGEIDLADANYILKVAQGLV